MRKKFTVLDLIFSIGHNSDDIPVTVKTTREEVGTAPSLRWMENPRHCGPGILEAKVKELTICDHCMYLGEGDFVCDLHGLGPEETGFVMEDWEPTEHFLQCMKEARHE